ncbi:Group IIE secretory phospholipase A2 [Tupaia chinensis]|uniref:Phospholipase A2 n=1 Tax=Tupaia chinensis TaxID=246437 RepID=L9L576_TUPCH|nr:Group IIE secretory phospholipase A2 [Tupaia chinensis]
MKPPPVLTLLCILEARSLPSEVTLRLVLPEPAVAGGQGTEEEDCLEGGGAWARAVRVSPPPAAPPAASRPGVIGSNLPVALAGGNLVQFGVMIERMTGKPALQCCHAHDCCYGRLEKLGCEPKLEKYLFSVGKDNIFCAGRTTCQRQTCECDRRAALCFRRHLGTYNRKYAHYPNKLCTGPTPPC